MKTTSQNETFDRILDIAEELFMVRGYKAVRLRDIADAVGMRHASLYYYVPKGKEQLFIAVMRRSMDRHEREMTRLIETTHGDIRAQAFAISDWLVSQPPLHLVRVMEVDLREIDPVKAGELSAVLLNALTKPLVSALQRASENGEVTVEDPAMAAMALITMIQSIHHIAEQELPGGRQVFARRLTEMLLYGWLKR